MSYFFSTQLYSKTPIETLEPRLSRYLVWWLCINLQFSIEGFYIQVQLSDCDVWLTVCIQSLNGNISLEISTFRVNVPTIIIYFTGYKGKPPIATYQAQSSLFCDEIKSITNFLELLEGDNFLSPYFGGEISRRRNRIDQGLAIIIMVHH